MNRDGTAVPATRRGWRIPDWAADVGISPGLTRKLIDAGTLPSVLVGDCRVIVVSPEAYLKQRAEHYNTKRR